jgi:fluoride exporter
MVQVLLVGLGGMIGSVLRYVVASGLQKGVSESFPVGTMAVNLLGCLAIGVFASVAEVKQWTSPEARLFVTTGILGGFTTFSAFGYETFRLLRESAFGFAAASVFGNVVIGTVAVGLGWMLGKTFAS